MELATVDLLDCHGHVTHRLTLEVDGTVTIRFTAGGHAARVDPSTRTNLTPHITVPPSLLDDAATLHAW